MIAFKKRSRKEFAKIGVVRLEAEAEGAGVAEEMSNPLGKPRQRRPVGVVILLSMMWFVLLFLGSGIETLPRKATTQKVHEDAGEVLKVVAVGMFDVRMSDDGCVVGGTSEVLILAVDNVEVRLGVTDFFARP